MKKTIFYILKKFLPNIIVSKLNFIYSKYIDLSYFYKNYLNDFLRIRRLRDKKSINVVFLTINESMWKSSTIYKKMVDNPYFNPVILVCPYTDYGDDRMKLDMERAYNFFQKNNYKVYKSLLSDGEWLDVRGLNPDLFFFSYPHNLTISKYYNEIYEKYLCCYIPYSHGVSKYNNYYDQYNQQFHNSMWMIFVPNKYHKKIYLEFSNRRDVGVFDTGYPFCENFFNKQKINNADSKLNVIIAPHHTIEVDDHLQYSNFLKYADFFRKLPTMFENNIKFFFKPHPILKSKLYSHPNWGVKKTDEYYSYWADNNNTSLQLGSYVNLFCNSDALIHDSGSFLVEYLYLKKPVLYLESNKSIHIDSLNEFGLNAKNSCKIGKCEQDILDFLEKLINNQETINSNFFDEELYPYFDNIMPSDKIIKLIFDKIKGK